MSRWRDSTAIVINSPHTARRMCKTGRQDRKEKGHLENKAGGWGVSLGQPWPRSYLQDTPDLGPICRTPLGEASSSQDHVVPHPAPLGLSRWFVEVMGGQIQQLETHRRSHTTAENICRHKALEALQLRLESFNIQLFPSSDTVFSKTIFLYLNFM